MRCYNCNKNFDYEKYYGICPKCGCFNRKETMEEQHEALKAEYRAIKAAHGDLGLDFLKAL